MFNATDRPVEAFLKDGDSSVDVMPRSHDTWILLLVVAILSTLLVVIVLGSCTWLCSRFCIHPSVLQMIRRDQIGNYHSTFPPKQREFVDVQDFAGMMNSLLGRREEMEIGRNKTGTSEKLGYKSNSRHASVPILPPPRSWTPSPPFPHIDPSPPPLPPHPPPVHHSSYRHKTCRQCIHCKEENLRFKYNCPHCQLCPYLLEDRLNNLKPKHIPKDASPLFQSAYMLRKRPSPHPPANTPNTVFKISRPKNAQHSSTDSSFEQLQTFIKHDNSKMKRSKRSDPPPLPTTSPPRNMAGVGASNCIYPGSSSLMTTNPELEMSDGRKRIRGKLEHSYKSKTRSEIDTFETSEPVDGPLVHNFLMDGKEVIPNMQSAYPRTETSHSSCTIKSTDPKKSKSRKKRFNPPVAVFLESPSSESSSDLTSALSRSSKTYWKIYHQPEEEQVEEEDSELQPSMSWDHLTPDPSPIQEPPSKPRINVDPTNATVIYFSKGDGNHFRIHSSQDEIIQDLNMPSQRLVTS